MEIEITFNRNMEIEITFNGKPFIDTSLGSTLHLLLSVVRLIVFSPLLLIIFCSLPIMYILSVKTPLDVISRFCERLVFNWDRNQKNASKSLTKAEQKDEK